MKIVYVEISKCLTCLDPEGCTVVPELLDASSRLRMIPTGTNVWYWILDAFFLTCRLYMVIWFSGKSNHGSQGVKDYCQFLEQPCKNFKYKPTACLKQFYPKHNM